MRLRVILLVMLLAAASLAAANGRLAMVLKTEGDVKIKIGDKVEPPQTLQVLPEGAVASLAEGAELRLSYLSDRSKETIEGPCTVKLTTNGAELVKGEGSLNRVKADGSQVMVPKNEKIQRAGGQLQAQLYDTRIELGEVAMAPVPPDLQRGPIELAPSIVFSRGEQVRFHARPARGPYRVIITEDVPAGIGNYRAYNANSLTPKLPIQPGAYYVRLDTGAGSAETGIIVLDKETADSLDALRKEAKTKEDKLAALTTMVDFALVDESLDYVEELVKEYPDDAGLLSYKAMLLKVLGDEEQARQTWKQVQEMKKPAKE
ncbi:MAG: hypothetical protein AB7S38_12520 [Vulcanimicrobiota bacterium]